MYLINQLPINIPKLKSPYETPFGDGLNYNKLKNFGCGCFPWLCPYSTYKLELMSKPYIFFEYCISQSALNVLVLFVVVCIYHVILFFYEFTFSYHDLDISHARVSRTRSMLATFSPLIFFYNTFDVDNGTT